MNLNTTRFILPPEDFLQLVRLKWHFMLSGVLLPVVCVVSLLENAIAIAVLLQVRTGRGSIGATSRAYYIVLAVANIGNLVFLQLGKQFAEYGLRYLTGGRLFFSLPDKSVHFSKLCVCVCVTNIHIRQFDV